MMLGTILVVRCHLQIKQKDEPRGRPSSSLTEIPFQMVCGVIQPLNTHNIFLYMSECLDNRLVRSDESYAGEKYYRLAILIFDHIQSRLKVSIRVAQKYAFLLCIGGWC
jgi:hypothetical protein